MDMEEDNLALSDSTCRACLSSLGAKIKIFSIHGQTSHQYSHIFSSCLSIQVELEDGLPKLICKKCLNKLLSFYKFKKVTAQNDLRLREALRCKKEKKIECELEATEAKVRNHLEFGKRAFFSNKSTLKTVESEHADIKNEIKQEKNDNCETIKTQTGPNEDSNASFENYEGSEVSKIKLKEESYKTTHQCDICGKILSCKSNLNQHLRKHTGERRHNCDACGKKFFKAEHLIVHRRTHTGERPHQCTICPKKFIQYAALKAHLRTHSGERPHMCSICGKSFSQSSTLAYHIRIHSGETPFTCKLCGKGFKTSGNLNIHRRFHNNERPFSCKICGKKFVTSSHLNVHVKQHNGIKSHQCIVCGKAFVRSEHLKGHLVIHTGQKPHACSLCPKKYTQNSHLTRHMKTHKVA